MVFDVCLGSLSIRLPSCLEGFKLWEGLLLRYVIMRMRMSLVETRAWHPVARRLVSLGLGVCKCKAYNLQSIYSVSFQLCVL